jgi:hypothetical protein
MLARQAFYHLSYSTNPAIPVESISMGETMSKYEVSVWTGLTECSN